MEGAVDRDLCYLACDSRNACRDHHFASGDAETTISAKRVEMAVQVDLRLAIRARDFPQGRKRPSTRYESSCARMKPLDRDAFNMSAHALHRTSTLFRIVNMFSC
jgi:hypothetical protein